MSMSEIVGGSVLGFGFNILGEYNISSVTSQLFKHNTLQAQTYTYPPTGMSYSVPDNTTVVQNTTTTANTMVFNTSEQFQNYYAAKAGVKGSYGCFSAEFDMAYSGTFNTQNSYYYGLSEADFTGWNLILSDQSSDWLSPSFLNDPLVKDLPDTFTPSNQDDFFELFRKFGTHVVTQLTVGGSLSYYEAVETSYSSSEQQIQANLSLEFNAVFYSASSQAEAEWSQLGQNWANSRTVTVNAVGGDTSVLNVLDPTYGSSDSSIFTTWSQAVMQNPAVISFGLRPLSVLFSGNQATAVDQALQAYCNGALLAMAVMEYTPGQGPGGGGYTTGGVILLNGNTIAPSPPVTPPPPYVTGQGTSWQFVYPLSAFQIALFDPNQLTTLMSHTYYISYPFSPYAEQVYQQMMLDINGISAQNYLVAVTAFCIPLWDFPSSEFAAWLTGCGASLSGWRKYIGFTGSPGACNYVMIGKKGLLPGSALESFSVNTDWVDWPASLENNLTLMLYTGGNTELGAFVEIPKQTVPLGGYQGPILSTSRR